MQIVQLFLQGWSLDLRAAQAVELTAATADNGHAGEVLLAWAGCQVGQGTGVGVPNPRLSHGAHWIMVKVGISAAGYAGGPSFTTL